MKIKISTFLLTCFVAGIVATAEAQDIGSTGVNRTSYERGVSYTGEPFGWIATTCNADDFSGVIVYGDSPNEVPMKHNAQPVPPGPHVPIGKYTVSNDNKIYYQVGTYTMRTEARIHCVNAPPGTVKYSMNTTITVYDRLPVHSLETVVVGAPTKALGGVPTAGTKKDKKAVQGDIVNFLLTLTAPAPPSDTRVKIILDRPDLFVNPPKEVIVPAGHTQLNFYLELRGDVDPGTEAFVSAVTAGDPTRLLRIKFRGQ